MWRGMSRRRSRTTRRAVTPCKGWPRASSPQSTARTRTSSACPSSWSAGCCPRPARTCARAPDSSPDVRRRVVAARPNRGHNGGVMSAKLAKIGLTVVVLGAAFFMLFRASMAEGTSYYKHVEEVMTTPEAWYGKRLQIHGFVTKDSIRRKRESLDYRFSVESKGQIVEASYSGV